MLSNVYENITFVRRTTEAALASVAQGRAALGQAALGQAALGQERRWVHNSIFSLIVIIVVLFNLFLVISFTPYDRAPSSSLSLSHD